MPTRRVSHVRWGGVDLAALLADAGLSPDARFLWSYGLDGGDFAGTHCDWYLKDLPLERLQAGGVLLAYELNGAPLPAEHGFPVRLVVPGYYGTNSVKWLWRLQPADRRAEGPFVSKLYNDALDAVEMAAGQPVRRPVWAVAPESIIVAPARDATLARGEPVEIWGWAWSFRGVARVEISTDGGAPSAPPRSSRGTAGRGNASLYRGDPRTAAKRCSARAPSTPMAPASQSTVHAMRSTRSRSRCTERYLPDPATSWVSRVQ